MYFSSLTADFLVAMPLNILIKYSDNISHESASSLIDMIF